MPDRRGVRTRLRVPGAVVAVVIFTLLCVGPAGAAAPTAPTRTVRVAVRAVAPFVIVGKDGTLSGFSVDLTRAVAAKEGVAVDFVVVPDIPAQLEALRSGRADAAIGAITITSERENVVDFSQPMFDAGIQIGVRDAPAAFSFGELLAQIFTRTLVVLLVVMVMGTLLTGTAISVLERRRGNPEFTETGIRGVFDGIWWATVTLFTIGYGDKVPRRVASRVITIVWMFAGVLLVATLTAEVTAGLTVERIDQQISSVSDLAGRKVVTVANTTSAKYLSQRGIDATTVPDAETAYDDVMNGRADAIVFDSAVVQYLIAQRGGVRLAGPIIQPESYGIAFPIGSQLRQPVNRALLAAREDGTYNRIFNSYFG